MFGLRFAFALVVAQIDLKLTKAAVRTTPTHICGLTEEFRRCGTACEPTCKQPNPLVCTAQCIVNVCQCRNGYVRSSNGQCVLPDSCPSTAATPTPSCGPNETFRRCGTACEPTCAHPGPRPCTRQCILNVCQCKRSYMRSLKGQCVRLASCPLTTSENCPPGVTVARCLLDPCSFAKCRAFPHATCHSQYCGGCNTEFHVDGKRVDCTAPTRKTTRRTQPPQCPSNALYRSRGPRCYMACTSSYRYFVMIKNTDSYFRRPHPAGCYCRVGYIASVPFGKNLTCLRYGTCPRSLRRRICD